MSGFTEQEEQLLRRLKWAANDPTRTEDLIFVKTAKDGQSRLALCILYRDTKAGVCRVEPVALLLDPEEVDKLENPITGRPGLPWVELDDGVQILPS